MSQVNTKEVIDNQRKDWNRVAPGWEKWDELLDRNLAFVNYRLVGNARVRTGQKVLDLGSGTGYPALLAAGVVGSRGSVIGLDLAEEMLSCASRKAESMGYAHIKFQPADVTSLPFDSNSFDAVISRFCLMFLPDIPKAIGEIARVLKPGSYLSAAVWSAPEKNPYLRIPMDAIKKFIEIPPPDPSQPGIFRLAKPKELFEMTEKAGLKGIADDDLEGVSPFNSAEEYLSHILDIAAPIQNLMAKLRPDQKKETEKEIVRIAGQYRKNGEIHLPITVRIVVAQKPA